MLDLIIIGAGAAGLSAAIYAARAGLSFVVLDQDGFGGGQIMSSHEVENYPGLPRISGEALADAFRSHAQKLGAEITYGMVQEIRNLGDEKMVVTDEGEYTAKAVIVATGARPRRLDVPGEEEFTGRGVSYCAICDGSFYAGKDVLVIGGGDTAVGDALYLSSLCRHVSIALRRKEFRGAARGVEMLKQKENVTIYYEAQLLEVIGEEQVNGVVLWSEDPQYDGEVYLDMDGVFIAVGVDPVSECMKGLELPMQDGYVVCDETCATAIPGIYVAGDLRRKPLRQVITAAADGANAVSHLVEWLQGMN